MSKDSVSYNEQVIEKEFDKGSYILRSPHDEENPYALVLNELTRNKNLSPKCRWFLIFCLTNEKSWKITPKQIMHEQNLSRDVVYGMIREAMKFGYMHRETHNNEKGHVVFTYFVSERNRFIKENIPNTENPTTEIQYIKNKQSLQEQYTLSKEINKESQTELIFQREAVKMKMSQYESLVKDLGQEVVNKTIDSMNYMAQTKPKKWKEYASHHLVLRKWAKEDKIKQEAKKVYQPKAEAKKVDIRDKDTPDASISLINKLKEAFPQTKDKIIVENKSATFDTISGVKNIPFGRFFIENVKQDFGRWFEIPHKVFKVFLEELKK